MIKCLHTTALLIVPASFLLSWGGLVLAAANGNLGVSAAVMDRCRVDFSEGSADYFQTCSSVEVKASGTASNVLGELTAVEASADPYYLDRDPDSQGMAAGSTQVAAVTSAGATSSTAATPAARRKLGPKVVTISY